MSKPLKGPEKITSPGDYHFANDMTVSGTAFEVAAPGVRLDVRGRLLQDTTLENPWTFGVVSHAEDFSLFDSVGSGRITGFRVGVKANAPNARIFGVDLSNNRYIGAWLFGASGHVKGCRIEEIGGVTDERYAIGVQVDGARCQILQTLFRNIYAQAGHTAGAAGEGVAVNFSALSVAGLMSYCTAINDEVQARAFGVFGGEGGEHIIESNTIIDFRIGIAVQGSSQIPSYVRSNTLLLRSPFTGSVGIILDHGDQHSNNVIGYERPLAGRADQTRNFVLPALSPQTLCQPLPPSRPPPPLPAENLPVELSAFDGVTDYFARGSDLDGNSDSKVGTVSGFVCCADTSGGEAEIYFSVPNGLAIQITEDGHFRCRGRNSDSINILDIRSTFAIDDGQVHHFMAAWNLATGAVHIYINNVECLAANPTLINDLIDHTVSDHGIGAAPLNGGLAKLNGKLGRLYINLLEYVDLSIAENRRTFFHAAGLDPSGSLPTGSPPIIFLNNPHSSFHLNLGTGGGFIRSGSTAR